MFYFQVLNKSVINFFLPIFRLHELVSGYFFSSYFPPILAFFNVTLDLRLFCLHQEDAPFALVDG